IFSLVTRWSEDPWTLGSYTSGELGCSEADRSVYSSPLPAPSANPGSSPASPRVHFAGEATVSLSEAYQCTHGAFWSGVHRASDILRACQLDRFIPPERRIVDYLIGRLPPQEPSHPMKRQICRTSAAAQASKEESVSQSAPSLLQVTLLYRHGERTPVHTFPLDPYKQLFRPYGSEQLLEEGVRQHFELGKYLRRRYWSLLPRRFNVTRMHVRSTDTDRTIMSAQANLAGLFPEQCSAAVDGAAQLPACYPVPIHTVPKPTDQLLKMSSPCPAYTRHWREFKLRPDGPYASAGRRFTWLSERARVGTGWRQGEPLGISELWKIADPIAVWRSLGLKLPDWVDRDVIAGLEELRHLKFAWKFSEPKLYGSRIGALMARLIGDMEARLAGRSNKILQVYSAHDSTVSAFLSAFGVFNNLQPPLAACAMLELYSDGEVRLFYRNATTTTNSSLSADPPLPMLIPFCQKPCLLSQLAKQMRKREIPCPVRATSLVQLQLVFRHGIRNPIRMPPNDPYAGRYNATLGQLTPAGAKQMRDLGHFVRTYYAEQRVLPERYDPNVMWAYSTDTDRTLASCQAFLLGLFRNQSPGTNLSRNGSSVASAGTPIPIHSGPKKSDVLKPT
uniref:Amino_oxidase domain-containing protein n=1 Tax=Macrostomum lignano TaxID=282301 RepID=A0A1I8IWV4_9PLAT